MIRRYYYFFSIIAALVLTGASCIQFGATASGPAGMYRTANKGENWQQIAAYPTVQGVKSLSGVKVFRIYVDPGDPDALYLGSRGQGLFYSYNQGDSWQAVSAMNNRFIYGLAVDPRDKCAIYISDGPHIYKTTDCARSFGTVFTEGRPNQRFVSLAVDYGSSNVVYGAEIGGDILRSLDGGASWATIARLGIEPRYMVADPNTPQRIYVASYRNGLQRSDDRGNTWTDLSAGFDSFSDSHQFHRLILNPTQADSLFWVSKYGILRSDDAGGSWAALPLLTPPGSVNIYSFAVNPKNQREMYYTGTILDDKGKNLRSTFYKSADGGATWKTKTLPTNTIPVDMMVHKQNGNVVFLGFTDAQ